jgi:hypothetical protein
MPYRPPGPPEMAGNSNILLYHVDLQRMAGNANPPPFFHMGLQKMAGNSNILLYHVDLQKMAGNLNILLYHVDLQRMAGNANPPFPRGPPENGGKFKPFFTTWAFRKCGKFKPLFYHADLQKMREIQTYFFTTLASRKWRENQTLSPRLFHIKQG